MREQLDVIDLTGDAHAQSRAIYKLVTECWWPHGWHGVIRYAYNESEIVFLCPCGDSLTILHEQAQELGLI